MNHATSLRGRLTACAALGALAALVSVPATAQQETAQRSQPVSIEEIVVTAKQRAESIQDVPLSITAFNEAALERTGIKDIRDLSAFTPGLSFQSLSGRRDISALAIRGLSPNTPNEQLQGVSTFYNGVYVGGSINLVNIARIERVEVLKGPQATTFGRATYAGAIDYVTKKPKTDTLAGDLKLEYSMNRGAKDGNWDALASVDLPLIQNKLWANAFVNYKRQGTLFTSPTGQPIGKENTDSYGATFYAEPSDNITVTLLGLYDQARDSQPAVDLQHPQEWRALGLTLGGGATPGFAWLDDNVPAPRRGTTDCTPPATTIWKTQCGTDKDRTFLSGIFTYDLNGYELSYRVGYYHEDAILRPDQLFRGSATGVDPFFGTAAQGLLRKNVAGIYTGMKEEFDSHSHQLRVVSPGDQRLRWRAGLYYFFERDTNFLESNVSVTNPKGRSRGNENVENYAAFGGAAYDLTQQFTLELEARAQKETNIFTACDFCPVTSRLLEQRKEGNTEFLPRVTLSYKPAEGYLLYALYSYGTKAGRWNNTVATNFAYVNPEKLTNYEAGFKSQWLDNRLIVNGAGYYQRVKDQQFVVQFVPPTGGAPVSTASNIGRSEIYGFELEGVALLTENIRLVGGLAYAHQEYVDFARLPTDPGLPEILAPVGGSLKGKSSISVPRWNGSLGIAYTTEALGGRNLELRADGTYRGKSFADAANRATYKATAKLNLRATLTDEMWSVGLWVRDVFDTKNPTGGSTIPNTCTYAQGLPTNMFTAASIVQRCLAVSIPRGREIGISTALKF
jgi:outer membrane receptor protein involved in Fe transport